MRSERCKSVQFVSICVALEEFCRMSCLRAKACFDKAENEPANVKEKNVWLLHVPLLFCSEWFQPWAGLYLTKETSLKKRQETASLLVTSPLSSFLSRSPKQIMPATKHLYRGEQLQDSRPFCQSCCSILYGSFSASLYFRVNHPSPQSASMQLRYWLFGPGPNWKYTLLNFKNLRRRCACKRRSTQRSFSHRSRVVSISFGLQPNWKIHLLLVVQFENQHQAELTPQTWGGHSWHPTSSRSFGPRAC